MRTRRKNGDGVSLVGPQSHEDPRDNYTCSSISSTSSNGNAPASYGKTASAVQKLNEPSWEKILKLIKLKEDLDAKQPIKKKPEPSSPFPSSPTPKKILSHPPPPKSLANTPTKLKSSVQDNQLPRTSYKNTPARHPYIHPKLHLLQLLLNQSKRKEIKVQKHR